MAKQLVIQSTDPHDTPVDIEEKLEKAVMAIQSQREQRQFTDLYLKDKKQTADDLVHRVFNSLVDEISQVLAGTEG